MGAETRFTPSTAVMKAPAYIINKSGSTITAIDGDNGQKVKQNTDAATVIQFCIDALEARGLGGIIFIRAETYTITNTLLIEGDSICLVGEGMDGGTHLNLGSGADCDLIHYHANDEENWFFCQIRDIYITGNKNNNASGSGIVQSQDGTGGANDMHLERVFVGFFKECGIKMVNAWGNHISNCLSENNETDGINITGTQVYLNNVYSAMNDGHGIDCRAYHVTMTNVQSYSNGKNGFYILNGEQAYTNCIASRSDQLETTWSDFYIMSANGIQLTNCFSLGEAEIAHPINGFRIRSSTRITLNTCTAEECVTGIYIQDDCTKVIINNCVVETNTTPITDSAPDTIIKNTIGYVTENYGSMSGLLCSGFVAHGLATAPIYINLTPGHGGCVCKDYNATVTSGSINASGFHVSLVTTCSGVPASGLVYWEAKV